MPKIAIPEDFLCPITQELMIDPVATADGQIYERRAIEQWLEKSDKSPLTNLPLKNKDLIAIPFVKNQIQSFFKNAQICTQEEFFMAIKNGDIVKFKQLNYLDSHLEATSVEGNTPLHYAVSQGSTELVKLLLEAGANVCAQTQNNSPSPLHCAALLGYIEITKLLLSAGAHVEATAMEDNQTPLHMAVFRGHVEIVKLLLAANANVEAMTDISYTPLNLAVDNGCTEIVKLLLAAKANPNFRHKCKGDLKPLHCAALDGQYEILKLLVAAGADLEAKTDVGNTPLHCAVINNHIEIIQLLLALNANLEIRNSVGNTPFESAISFGYMEAAECIQAHSKKQDAKRKIKQAIELNAQCVKQFQQENYSEAIKCGLIALQIFLQGDADMDHIAICYYNLGSSYLKIYEKSKLPLGLSPLKESIPLTTAILNLKKALSLYSTLNNKELLKKIIDKINVCLKYKLWDKLTYIQRKIFDRLNLKPIHIAIIFSDFSLVKDLYALDAKCLEQCDDNGWAPLIYGLFFKASLDLVTFLIEKNTSCFLQKYTPMAFADMHNYCLEVDLKYFNKASGFNPVSDATLKLLYADRDCNRSLDSEVSFPPIFYALNNLEIVSNLTGTWSNDVLIRILRLLITQAPEQLELLEGSQANDCCALAKALACKLPEDSIMLLIENTSHATFLKSGAIMLDNALKSHFQDGVIERLILQTPAHMLEEQPILVNALRSHYSEKIIKILLSKNPNCIKAADIDVLPLFAAICSKASLKVVELLLAHDTTAALKLTGATILSYWDDEDSDDEEWVKGYNVTSLILALIFDRFDIANYLLECLPQLIDIKDENDRLPISYVEWKKIPLEYIKKILVLNVSNIYKEESCRHILKKLLNNERKEVVNLSLQLGFGIGANIQKSVIATDTSAGRLVIGMSVNGETVTRKMPGFAQSITNIEELCFAQKQEILLKTDKEFEYFINLVQSIIISKKQQPKNEELPNTSSNFVNSKEANFNMLVKFEKWLILNKPISSLTHLCIRFIGNQNNLSEIDLIKDKLPPNLIQKLSL